MYHSVCCSFLYTGDEQELNTSVNDNSFSILKSNSVKKMMVRWRYILKYLLIIWNYEWLICCISFRNLVTSKRDAIYSYIILKCFSLLNHRIGTGRNWWESDTFFLRSFPTSFQYIWFVALPFPLGHG